MLLSLIILNYDTRELLQQCLASIPVSSPGFELEILIVNNGSPSDTAASLEGLHPNAVVLDLPVNVGFGQANNLAAARARGQYLLLLNSDTYFLGETLAKVSDFLGQRPAVDVFGCRVLDPDGSPQKSAHSCPFDRRTRVRALLRDVAERNPLVEFVRRRYPRAEPTLGPTAPKWLSGCCLFVRREVFERTGGFDPDFYLYYEEMEWFYNRVFDRGYTIEVCQDVRLVHLGGASQARQAMNQQAALSSYLFYHKLGRSVFWAAAVLTFVNLLVRAACTPFVRSYFRENVELVGCGFQLLALAIREVPWHGRGRASRPAPLMLTRYAQTFSWSRMSESMLASPRVADPK